MYKCTECETVFEEPKTWKESRGEFWGIPCSETMCGCPECGEHFEEAIKCKRCGEWFFEEELNDGLCECCYDELFN